MITCEAATALAPISTRQPGVPNSIPSGMHGKSGRGNCRLDSSGVPSSQVVSLAAPQGMKHNGSTLFS